MKLEPSDAVAPAPETSRRERKKQATREALRTAALDLFASEGFGAVTVEQICDLADVAPSTFFRHFATKEDVVLAELTARGEELLEALARQPADASPRELLMGALDQWQAGRRPAALLRTEVVLLAAEPDLMARLDRVLVAWEQPVAAILADRYGATEGSDEVRLAAAWYVATIRTVIRNWALDGASDDVFAPGRQALERLATAYEGLLPGG